MNSEPKSKLSNNNLRRMQGWARAKYPHDWQDRCAVVTEYLVQLSESAAADLIRKGWPDAFETAERDWPEAFVGWKQESSDR